MRYPLFALFFVMVAGCASVAPERYNYASSKIYDKPYDEVWSAVIEGFATNNIPIKTLEKASGIIVTDEMNVPWQKPPIGNWIETDWCDCGRPGGTVALVHCFGKYNIFVKKVSDSSTSVQVNSKFHSNIYDPMFHGITGTQECNSKGLIEGRIFSSLDSKL